MAERTKFLSYCIYSAVISALIYPIEAHWIWGGGWLSQTGSHDFADSCAIHMVGGICALSGAKILGPRIGKFVKDRDKIPVETVVEAARKARYSSTTWAGSSRSAQARRTSPSCRMWNSE